MEAWPKQRQSWNQESMAAFKSSRAALGQWLCTAHRFTFYSLFLLAGCDAQTTEKDRPSQPIRGQEKIAGNAPAPASSAFDLGVVLMDEAGIHHDFTITNKEQRPIRIVRTVALTPCCSDIGPCPESISVGGTARIPVLLRPASSFGRKGVQFFVETDSEKTPKWWFTLSADLRAAWEVKEDGGLPLSLLPGEGGEGSLRLITRRKGKSGLSPPKEIQGIDSIKVEPKTKWAEREDIDGLTEYTSKIAVTLPAFDKPGHRRASLLFRWADGTSRYYLVHWEVTPLLHITPSGLIIRGENGNSTHAIVIRATDGKPFRIVNLAGRLPFETLNLTHDSSNYHRIEIRFDISGFSGGGAHDLRITTDHPRQTAAILSVIAIPR